MNERLTTYDSKMTKTINNLDGELATIRAGRANPHVLDKLRVDYYGTPTPIQQVANVNVPEPRMIQIQPWEASMVKEIEKVIMTSDLGINPTNDGKTIRLLFPELTEERRKDLAKDVKKKGESAKVAIRNIRRDANDSFKKLAKEDVSEDEIKAYRAAVGIPESPAKYDLKTGRLPAGVTVDEDTTAEYKKLAHEMGLTPKQAQSLFEFDIRRQGEDYQAYLNLRKESAQEAMNELKKTYGEKYEEKLSHALRIVAKLGGDELKSELEASGLGNNIQLINFMVKVSENYSEDGIIVGSVGGSNTVNLDNLYGKSMAHLPDRR